MEGNITFDELWEELKDQSEDTRDFYDVAETVSSIINDIVRARVNRGWSQRDLARVCGVKQSAIARMERLQAIPRLDTVVKIARKLNVKICAQPVLSLIGETDSVVVATGTTTKKQTLGAGTYHYNNSKITYLSTTAIYGGAV